MTDALDLVSRSVSITRDLIGLVLGDPLGGGSARQVYEWLPDPTLVAKVEHGAGSFQNVEEWETWREVDGVAWHQDWFAPCVSISGCGSILLQRRTVEPQPGQRPLKLPRYLTDRSIQNYGMLDGRLVCHDYGTNILRTHGLTKHMTNAGWWDQATGDDVDG